MEGLKNEKQRAKKLSSDFSFNLAFWGGVILGLLLSLVIAYLNHNNLDWCSKPECFSNLLAIYDFPIKVAVALITLSGIRALVFRSEQSAIQIEETEKQNIFSNYVAHRCEFFNVLKKIESEKSVNFYESQELYSRFFPSNSPNYVEFESWPGNRSNSFLTSVVAMLNALINEFRSAAIIQDKNERLEQYKEWFAINYASLLDQIGLQHMESEIAAIMKDDTNKDGLLVDRVENELFIKLRHLTAIVTTICNFSQPSGLTGPLSICCDEHGLMIMMYNSEKARKNPTMSLSATLPE